jgi:glycosyltransferase involved in cell wall biosynthesis
LANPNAALANHLVMGPAILARALVGTETPYAVKIHGSALEYTVKPYPRFLPYAREGIRAANGVLVSSRHTAESLWTTLKDPALPARTRLAPPGVDVSNFHPVERAETISRLRSLADAIAKRERSSRSEPAPERSQLPGASGFARDSAATSNALRTLAQAARGERVVAFIGKLIVAKGIDLLLLAWPLVLASIPAVRLAVVGFGGYRAAAERLVDALAAGDLASIHALLSAGRAAEGGAASPLTFAISFLDSLARTNERDIYLAAARNMRERVAFTGRLEHDELGVFLPLCEAIVVPSTFPESFGMVAVEAAACGALPISAAHSGLAEVSRTLTTGLSKPVQELLSFNLDDRAVQSIAGHLIAWLRTPPGLRDVTRAHLAEAVAAHYSWDVVAQRVIAAAGGQLDQLVSPI